MTVEVQETDTSDTWCPTVPELPLLRSRVGLWGAFLTPWSWKSILQVSGLGPQWNGGMGGGLKSGAGGLSRTAQGAPAHPGSPKWNRSCSWRGGQHRPPWVGAPPEPLIAQKLVPVSFPALSLPRNPPPVPFAPHRPILSGVRFAPWLCTPQNSPRRCLGSSQAVPFPRRASGW